MLYEVTFKDFKGRTKKFIVSGKTESKCIDLAKKYIKKKGGSDSPAKMVSIKKLPK